MHSHYQDSLWDTVFQSALAAYLNKHPDEKDSIPPGTSLGDDSDTILEHVTKLSHFFIKEDVSYNYIPYFSLLSQNATAMLAVLQKPERIDGRIFENDFGINASSIETEEQENLEKLINCLPPLNTRVDLDILVGRASTRKDDNPLIIELTQKAYKKRENKNKSKNLQNGDSKTFPDNIPKSILLAVKIYEDLQVMLKDKLPHVNPDLRNDLRLKLMTAIMQEALKIALAEDLSQNQLTQLMHGDENPWEVIFNDVASMKNAPDHEEVINSLSRYMALSLFNVVKNIPELRHNLFIACAETTMDEARLARKTLKSRSEENKEAAALAAQNALDTAKIAFQVANLIPDNVIRVEKPSILYGSKKTSKLNYLAVSYITQQLKKSYELANQVQQDATTETRNDKQKDKDKENMPGQEVKRKYSTRITTNTTLRKTSNPAQHSPTTSTSGSLPDRSDSPAESEPLRRHSDKTSQNISTDKSRKLSAGFFKSSRDKSHSVPESNGADLLRTNNPKDK